MLREKRSNHEHSEANPKQSRGDVFAVISAIPEHLYVKFGQFQIPFGLKQIDHNILVRRGYQIGSNLRDVGVEVGGAYSPLFYNIVVFNGNRIALTATDNNQHNGLFDPDRQIKGDAFSRLTIRQKYYFIQNASLDLIYWLNIENKDRLEDEQVSDKNLLHQLEGNDQIILMMHFWF